MNYPRWVALTLARAALADVGDGGGSDAAAVAARLAATLQDRPAWLPGLAQALAAALSAGHPALLATTLADRIVHDAGFAAAMAAGPVPRVRRMILRPARMHDPPFALHDCPRPDWPTLQALADGLGLTGDALEWFAGDAQCWRSDDPRRPVATHHYRHRWLPKARGGHRLLEAPLPALKRIQRQLLHDLLDAVPVHEAAHGFVRGRSVAGHAALHAGRPVVLRFDLQDFFPSVRAARVQALWRTLGYPDGVARALTTLCTVRTPAALLSAADLPAASRQRLAMRHLPQGAPTSPALANLCAFRLDLRLEGLAWVFGARYSRYADDLVFSGPPSLRTRLGSFRGWLAGIVGDEGFALNPGKTLCMPQHRRQQVAGVVINQVTNLPREDYDRLKACLHRARLTVDGRADTQAMALERARLLGQIAWARQLNAHRGDKLRSLFDRIPWPAHGRSGTSGPG